MQIDWRRIQRFVAHLGSVEPWLTQPSASVFIGLLLAATLSTAYFAWHRPVDLRDESRITQRANTLAPSLRLDINTATLEQLKSIPRIGSALAARMINEREANGPFPSLDALNRIPGIDENTIQSLRPYLTAGQTPQPPTH